MNSHLTSIEIYLKEYLILHKKLYLPFVGTLQIVNKPAFFDKNNLSFQPSTYTLDFQQNLIPQETQDYDLFNFLKSKFYGNETLSKICFLNFIKAIFDNLNNSKFIWKNIGEFNKNENNDVCFYPHFKLAPTTNNLFKLTDSVDLKKSTLSVLEKQDLIEENLEKNVNQLSLKNIDNLKLSTVEMNNEELPIVEKTNNVKKQTPIKPELSFDRKKTFNNPIENVKSNNIKKPYQQTYTIDYNKYPQAQTAFLDTELSDKYSTFQKVFIITVLIVTLLYLFFHLFLNDFSFHSYSN